MNLIRILLSFFWLMLGRPVSGAASVASLARSCRRPAKAGGAADIHLWTIALIAVPLRSKPLLLKDLRSVSRRWPDFHASRGPERFRQ